MTNSADPPALVEAPRRRRADWRGERTPVLVRLPASVAEQLGQTAQQRRRSVSEVAAELIADGLAAGRPA